MASANKKFVISMYSPIGGQGASFLCAQLVHWLAKDGPACLLDLNLDYSSTLAYLNVEAVKAFRESAMGSDESERISSFAVKVEKNYFAVATPLIGYGQFAEDAREATRELFEQCRTEFDYTVVDLPHPLHVDLTKAALEMSDLVLVLCESSDQAAKTCVSLKQILQNPIMKLDFQKRVAFVYNRSQFKWSRRLTGRMAILLIFIVVVLVGYKLWQHLLGDALIVGAASVAMLAAMLPETVRDQTKSSKKILTTNKISYLQELPDDNKHCRWVINQGTFLDEKWPLGRAVRELAEKIKSHAALK